MKEIFVGRVDRDGKWWEVTVVSTQGAYMRNCKSIISINKKKIKLINK